MNKIIRGIWKYLHFKKRRYYMNKYGNEALSILYEIGKQTGSIVWLDYGTLLGAIRDHDFIKHDDDIDLGMLAKDYNRMWERAIFERGFSVIRWFQLVNKNTKEQKITELTLNYKGLQIDVFLRFQEDEESIVYEYGGFGTDVQRNYWPPSKMVFSWKGVESILFRGINCNIPKKADRYLEYIYGPDFMIPNPSWKGSSNIEPVESCYGQMMGVWH